MKNKNTDNKNLTIEKDILIQKEKLAAIGQLMSGVTHNLSTPLMGSTGQLMLSDRKLNSLKEKIKNENISKDDCLNLIEELHNHNSNIRNYLYYMSDVISTVKSYIRSSDSNFSQQFRIKDLFDKVLLLTSFEAKKNKISIIFNLDKELENHTIQGDINCIIQVLINLIMNSIDSYEGDPGNIEVSAEIIKEDNNSMVEFSVKDSGAGIKKAIQKQLMKKMITTKGKGGTGIGLYISNSMIKNKFDGIMRIESKLKQGTIVYIKIPN